MTEKRIPPDSAEYLAGPMPKYEDGTFTIHGKTFDANKLEPLDSEPPERDEVVPPIPPHPSPGTRDSRAPEQTK
jgi:hypothetical protein